MATRIRLRRIGSNPKKRPHFHISVFNETRNRDSLFVEDLGIYEPVGKGVQVKLNKERYDYWVKKGAAPTDTVKSLAKKYSKQ